MPSRHFDWLRQADADLRHARHALADGDWEWACFAAQQAAEKAIKAAFEKLHMEAWGHTTSLLLAQLPPHPHAPSPELIDSAKVLDKHYIPARYPNGFAEGAPTDFYTQREATEAISHAEAIIEFCRRLVESAG